LFTVTLGKLNVGVGVKVGEGVMVGVEVAVGVKVGVKVSVKVGVEVEVGVKVRVEVGVRVQAAAVAVWEVAVMVACSSGEGPQAESRKTNKSRLMKEACFMSSIISAPK